MVYGQEVYFSTPNTVLKKLQSIDSEAIKLAIGFPVHTNTNKSYADAGMISLSEQRKVASSQPIRNYINDLINECNIDIKSISVLPTS